MCGALATHAPHLDGTEPVGVWFDAAWAQYVNLMLKLDSDRLEALDDIWEELNGEDEPGAPTAENWGTSAKAQAGQAALMGMLGGMPGGMGDMGAAPPTSDTSSDG